MTYRYSSIAIILLLVSARSFAASAVLPPLPSQQPPPVVQDSANPPPPTSIPAAQPTPLAPPVAEKQNSAESLPPPTQAPIPSTSAPTQAPTSDAKKTAESPQGSQEESESFMDKGQKQLPRIQHGDKSADSGSYNPSDLRIPVIESAEKDAAKNSDQSNPRVSDNAAAPAPDAAQAVPAAYVGPDISLPEASHPAQAASSTAVAPSVSAQTPPQAPVTASEAVTAAPAVSDPPPSTLAPVVSPAPPAVATSAADAATPSIAQTPPQPSVPAVADAAPVLVPAPAPPLVPTPAPPPPPAPVIDVPQPQPQPQPAAPSPARQLTADQIKFIDDEAIVFTLANDDVELGEITEAAAISQMPAYNYIKLFWKSYKTPVDKMQKKDVALFLAMLESHPAEAYSGAMNYDEASDQAFDAASDGKLSDLRAIISYYPVLQMRDARGNNMLGSAIEADLLEVARFLLVRGIDLYATNYEGYDAFAIARDENNDEAADLLSRARFVGRK